MLAKTLPVSATRRAHDGLRGAPRLRFAAQRTSLSFRRRQRISRTAEGSRSQIETTDPAGQVSDWAQADLQDAAWRRAHGGSADRSKHGKVGVRDAPDSNLQDQDGQPPAARRPRPPDTVGSTTAVLSKGSRRAICRPCCVVRSVLIMRLLSIPASTAHRVTATKRGHETVRALALHCGAGHFASTAGRELSCP